MAATQDLGSMRHLAQKGLYPVYFAGIDQGTKTKIQIGDVPATLYVNENGNCIQFIKNGIEYTAGNLPDKGISR